MIVGVPYPSHEAVDAYTGFLIRKAAAGVFESFAARLAPHGLHPMHFGMLTIIAAEAPISQQALSERTGIDPSSMVARMDALEERGLVARVRSSTDRRTYEIRLTPRGKRLLEKVRAAAEAHGDEFFSVLSAPERDQLHRLLLKLTRGAEER